MLPKATKIALLALADRAESISKGERTHISLKCEGLCTNIILLARNKIVDADGPAFLPVWADFYKTWPEYSWNTSYPVPHTNPMFKEMDGKPEKEEYYYHFENGMDMYNPKTKYGQLRLELAGHLAVEIRKYVREKS